MKSLILLLFFIPNSLFASTALGFKKDLLCLKKLVCSNFISDINGNLRPSNIVFFNENLVNSCNLPPSNMYHGLIGIIDIFTNINNNFLEIKIIDTGIGLDYKITNFFEPYVTTKQNGTGLGLAIVRKIIEQHDGSLNIYNASNVLHRTFNKGAIAMIKLPLMLNKNKFKNDNSSEADFQIKEKIRTL